jgi:hypothetical protein
MIGAQKARILVKNQWRTKTIFTFFFVSTHDWRKKPMVAVYGRGGRARGYKGIEGLERRRLVSTIAFEERVNVVQRAKQCGILPISPTKAQRGIL